MTTAMNEAEKLADRLQDIATKYRFVSHEHGVIDGAAALLRRQAEQIKELREALSALYVAAPISLECKDFHHSRHEMHSYCGECKPKLAYLSAVAVSAAALAATKESE